jgi:integrase
VTIGSPDAWSIPQAQERARELQRQIDEGRDPREVKAAATAADVASREDARRQTVTVAEAWAAYLLDRRPHWGERHYLDHVAKAAPGGVMGKRSALLQPGILAALMPLALRDLDTPKIEAWAAREAKTRPTSARLAWRLLKAFLGWCAEQPAYAAAVPEQNPAKSKKARESLGKPGFKSDALQREQLPGWFAAVQGIPYTAAAAYLQTVLLTGARPGEVLEMRWEDLNTKWKGLTIRDKVEGERTIPLTPYVAHLLTALPRRNQYVFAGARADVAAKPSGLHARACKVAGLEGLTLHGLRRSFKSLTEWLDIPAGVVAQLMGHKPSATAERHYTVRPLDLLRVHHERIEAWILEQAGVQFDATAASGGLRMVVAA